MAYIGDLGLPFMNSTIRYSVTNYHFVSMQRTNKKKVLELESDYVIIKVIVGVCVGGWDLKRGRLLCSCLLT